MSDKEDIEDRMDCLYCEIDALEDEADCIETIIENLMGQVQEEQAMLDAKEYLIEEKLSTLRELEKRMQDMISGDVE